jgi:hypothetical protein
VKAKLRERKRRISKYWNATGEPCIIFLENLVLKAGGVRDVAVPVKSEIWRHRYLT